MSLQCEKLELNYYKIQIFKRKLKKKTVLKILIILKTEIENIFQSTRKQKKL